MCASCIRVRSSSQPLRTRMGTHTRIALFNDLAGLPNEPSEIPKSLTPIGKVSASKRRDSGASPIPQAVVNAASKPRSGIAVGTTSISCRPADNTSVSPRRQAARQPRSRAFVTWGLSACREIGMARSPSSAASLAKCGSSALMTTNPRDAPTRGGTGRSCHSDLAACRQPPRHERTRARLASRLSARRNAGAVGRPARDACRTDSDS